MTGTAVEERLFDDAAEMAQALADDLVARLTAAASLHGAAGFVASGGTTPGPVYELMSAIDAPWSRVAVTVSDERWTPADDPASNTRLLRERLLRGPAAAARFTSLLTAHPDPHAAAAEAEVAARLAAMPRPFEAVLLGMGADGHTASLFPGLADTARALDLADPALARGVGPVPGAAGAPLRMTLTLRALTDARRIVLLFRGEEKLAIFRRAQAEGGEAAALPVRALLRQRRAPVALYWAP